MGASVSTPSATPTATATKDSRVAGVKAAMANGDDDFRCGICRDLFFEPTSLPCGDTFCAVCLDGWIHTQCGHHFTCPTCRTQYSSKLIPRLGVNTTIQNLLLQRSPDARALYEKKRDEIEQRQRITIEYVFAQCVRLNAAHENAGFPTMALLSLTRDPELCAARANDGDDGGVDVLTDKDVSEALTALLRERRIESSFAWCFGGRPSYTACHSLDDYVLYFDADFAAVARASLEENLQQGMPGGADGIVRYALQRSAFEGVDAAAALDVARQLVSVVPPYSASKRDLYRSIRGRTGYPPRHCAHCAGECARCMCQHCPRASGTLCYQIDDAAADADELMTRLFRTRPPPPLVPLPLARSR
jgi:hypothetical protein